MVALAGIDPMRFLASTDQLEVQVAQAVATRRLELETIRDENRAQMIANAVGRTIFG